MAGARAKEEDDESDREDEGASPEVPPPTIAVGDATRIRVAAEDVRRILKDYERQGGNAAPFLPRIKRARRAVRRGDADGALRALDGLRRGVRMRTREREK